MLQAAGLRKSFGGRTVVDGVDLDLARGECFGLLGPNGAGKTTTISMLVGILPPDAGEIKLGGEPALPASREYRRRIGYVPQEIALYDELSAEENLRVFERLYGLSGAALEGRVDAALGIAGLTERRRDRVETFSGGMKRRLNTAAALLHNPEILVLDEPTVGVDPQSRNAIFDALDRLREGGKTLLYTTHYMEEVERLCERVAIMDAGRVVATGTLESLRSGARERRRVGFDIEAGTPPLEMLRSLPHVLGADLTGVKLSVEVETLDAALPHLLTALGAAGVRYGAIASDRPSLEEVFLAQTGRSLRDS